MFIALLLFAQSFPDALAGPIFLSIALFTAVLANFIIRGKFIPSSGNCFHSSCSPSSILSSNLFFQFVNCKCLNIFLDTFHRNRPTFLQAKEGNPHPRCRTLKFPLRHYTRFQCHRSIVLLPATVVATLTLGKLYKVGPPFF